ncbi:MAG: ABC transporter substrate-binding protein [Planctomycetota bacterium]|nr:ABC transporter substrate-binding protein [Planctomycetota bacterium]
MADEQTQLTPVGKIVSIVLILGLIGGGAYLVMNKGEAPQPGTGGGTNTGGGDNGGGSPVPDPNGGGKTVETAGGAEAPDTNNVTMKKEYKFVPAERLPAVKGVSAYKWDDKEKILRFSYNVWAGWLPVIAANKGTKPNEESVFFKKHGFKVELVLMDNPIAARDAYTAGEVHTLWGTVDMMTLFAPQLVVDSRTAPRIVQQVDWSNGGDGIVVRTAIKSVADLRGKTIALAQNSPSEYYLTSLMLSAGLTPKDINKKYTETAFDASAAFVGDKKIDACVSWAPDIYNIPDRVAGTRILSSTADANKLIADVYAVRADFARDHPEIVEGLVAGIFEGMEYVKAHPDEACKWMADAYGMKPEEALGMKNDAHPTNFAENVQFFLNASNPTNFERTWKNASYVYQKLGSIQAPVPFDQVMDFTHIKKLEEKGLFKNQKDESVASFTPASVKQIQAEAPILTQTIRINFFPNSSNPYELARDQFGNPVNGKLYDPNVAATLEEVARLSGQFARAVILIQGHTDSSMKGKVPISAVKDLSLARAEAIKRALIDKFKFDPNKFTIEGKGWEEPFDTNDPNNHALNRRVEISVYPPEQK